MISITKPFSFLVMPLLLLLSACATTEDTVEIVNVAPRVERTGDEPAEEDPFQEITIGLNDPVTNFDPLFADNLSTQRVVNLLYEGLFTLDAAGEPQPALASDIDISEDGRVYTITINREFFYHDSRVFTAGIGRRIHASDVKWAFERAARAGHPETAAELLMDVAGFENYFLEQRYLYDPEKRVLEEVHGIRVLDQQTVRIELNEPDPGFLAKLASPYLLVYPREAVLNSDEGLAQRPVGTGPYVLARVEDNGTIVLTKHRNENRQSRENQPALDQINLTYLENEETLFEQFIAGEIDWIPEAGPFISDQVVDESGELKPAYRDSFAIASHDAHRITAFYLNREAVTDHTWLRNRLAYLTPEDFRINGTAILNIEEFEVTGEAEPESQYYISYSDNRIARVILTQLHNLVFQPESELVFFDIRVPTRRTSIFTKTGDSILQNWNPLDPDYWLRIDTKIVSLYQPTLTGIQSSSVPWFLPVKGLRVQNGETAQAVQ